MSKIKLSLLCLAVAVIVLLAAGYTVVHSLWFLATFVPVDANAIVIAQQEEHPIVQLLNKRISLIGIDWQQAGIEPQEFTRLAMSKREGSHYLMGITKSWLSTNVQQNIQKNGWQAQSFGPFIYANKGPAATYLTAKTLLSRSAHGIWQVIVHMRHGNNPVAIIHIAQNSIPLADTTYDAVIRQQKDRVYITVTHPHSPSGAKISQEKNEEINQDSGLKFALSSTLLARIPNELQSASLQKIARDVHVTRKQADLTKLIKESLFIAGQSNASGTGIAMMGDTVKLASSLQKIVVEEEGYYHPERRAFRLPDGSIGFELRPGEPTAAWTQVNGSCGRYNGLEHQWWVCNNNSIASLGTSQEMAEHLLGPYDPAIWMVNLGKDTVPQNLQAYVKAIQAIGTSEETSITLR